MPADLRFALDLSADEIEELAVRMERLRMAKFGFESSIQPDEAYPRLDSPRGVELLTAEADLLLALLGSLLGPKLPPPRRSGLGRR